MRLAHYVQRTAYNDALALFDEHLQDDALRKEIERIRSLAQFEANHFYQAGFVLLFLKASWLGEEYEVKNLYTQTFIKTYQVQVENKVKNG
jgi:hypothetical protein